MSTAVLPPPVPPGPPTPPLRSSRTALEPRDGSHVAQTGVLIGIGTITMTFAALTSALIVRQAGAPDWHHLHLPSLLYLNTLVLLASSMTLESARRRQQPLSLHLTVALGLLFVVGQVLAWRQLIAQQQLLATGPSSAFFYVFTALHAAHVLGGVGGLLYVERRVVSGGVSLPTFRAAALYWHFMAVLWLYLLLLLTILG